MAKPVDLDKTQVKSIATEKGQRTYIVLPKINTSSLATNGIFLILILFCFYFLRDFFMPTALALILNFMLYPIVRFLKEKWFVPRTVSAILILIVILGTIFYGMYALSTPSLKWLATLPESIEKIQSQFEQLRGPVKSVNQAAKSLEEITDLDGKETPKVEIEKNSLTQIIFTGTQSFIVLTIVMAGILFFLITSGNVLYQRILDVLPSSHDRDLIVSVSRETEKQIFSYLITVTLINAGVGVATGIVLYFEGVPNPILWGVMTAVMNYVPYLGAIIGQIIIFLVSMTVFQSFSQVLWVAFSYFMLTSFLEGNFITPWILGKRFVFNPIIIVLWLFFWGWMWGIIGTILAFPMLVIFKSVCERVEGLVPIAKIIECRH